ncbi:MAG: hypothetical protein ACR652_03705 [Methylocystis sp.]|uniref:hypothetical protein n=1 Tax=Methylocystis sp. TaxID=1911079 RepID=UPI003DA1FBCD
MIFEALAERPPQSMAFIDGSIIRGTSMPQGKKGAWVTPSQLSWRIEHQNQVVADATVCLFALL